MALKPPSAMSTDKKDRRNEYYNQTSGNHTSMTKLANATFNQDARSRKLCSEDKRSPRFMDKHDFIPANKSEAKQPLKNDQFINHLEEYDRKKMCDFEAFTKSKNGRISGAFKAGKVPASKMVQEVKDNKEYQTFLEEREQMPRLSIL
jgi:hypothetical protein